MKITGTATAATEFECPPEDIYTLELTSYEEQPIKPGFNNDTNIDEYSVRLFFKIVDFPYDPDEDETDWNGTEIRQFYTWQRYDKTEEKMYSTYLSEKSKAFAIFSALLGRPVTPDDTLDLDEWIGRRVKATITENKNGWPDIKSPVKARSPKRAAKPKPAPEPEFDDDDEWPDE